MTRDRAVTARGAWRRRALVTAVVIAAALVAADLGRPADRQILGAGAVGAIHVYQRTVSPLIGRTGVRCHFTPTCSRYAEASIARHGLLAGGWLAVKRVARCGPWTPMGTRDDPK